jgi:hypothetical protein
MVQAWTETMILIQLDQNYGCYGGTSKKHLFFRRHLITQTPKQLRHWNGSAWTEVADLNTARWKPAGFGAYTAAICLVEKALHLIQQYRILEWNKLD